MELQRKAKFFKEERDKNNRISREWAEKRDKLNSRVGQLLDKAQEEKKKRDTLNKKVKKLKKEKQEIKDNLKEHQKIVNGIKNELDQIPAQELKWTMKIRKQIKNMEWKYQTNVIHPNEEKSIIDKIYQLESQLKDKKDLMEKLNELEDQLDKSREIEKILKEKQKEIISTADESQIHHRRMVNVYNEIDNNVRPKADDCHQKFIDTKKIADEHHKNLIMVIPRIKYLRKRLDRKRDDINKLSMVVESRVEKALEKMKEGKRLTLDEFQLLVKSGLI